MNAPQCRFCAHALHDIVVDLGTSPLSNAFITPEKYMAPESYYPLRVYFCRECGLVQLEEFASPEDIFSDYDYFSSFSDTWLRHAEAYVEYMTREYGINENSFVVEIASNDGYLLQHFLARGVPVLGIEPARNVADNARAKGIPTESFFFGRQTAEQLVKKRHAADLAIGNNVLAHVPDINDFVAGFATLLKPNGIATFEFPHLLQLIDKTQFDTIYHEHFSYLSLHTVQRIFAGHELMVFDVQALPTHGGSLRVFACHAKSKRSPTQNVQTVLQQEAAAQLDRPEGYADFAAKTEAIRLSLLEFLLEAHRQGKTVCGYGAAAKGNTLLNYCGVRSDLLRMVADKNPRKQGKFLPGSRIPVVTPEALFAARPDYVLVLPWNIKDEVFAQLAGIKAWGGSFVTAVPELRVWK